MQLSAHARERMRERLPDCGDPCVLAGQLWANSRPPTARDFARFRWTVPRADVFYGVVIYQGRRFLLAAVQWGGGWKLVTIMAET